MTDHQKTIAATIPFKAELKLEGFKMTCVGPKELLSRIEHLKNQFGHNVLLWPADLRQLTQKNNEVQGYDILIYEFILKLNNQFNLVYPHQELCHCRGIETEQVFNAIKDNQNKVEFISRSTQAGTGCGSCKKDIIQLISQFKN